MGSVFSTVLGFLLIIWASYCIVPTVLLSFLQWYLCGKNLRWGKVLPILAAVVSLLTTLLLVGVGYFVTGLSFSPVLFLLSLILFNIPTLVFCLVFRARRRRHEQTDLNRMRIDDLE